MAKTKSVFICNNCGFETPKWAGKCPDCGRWNSFEESMVAHSSFHNSSPRKNNAPVILSEGEDTGETRMQSGIQELDRVLGGGIFPGSVTLVAGDPGIGKSTLLLQMAGALLEKGVSVIYVSAEESFRQIRGRARRLNLEGTALPLLVETELEEILYQIEQRKAEVIIVDSIQAIFSQNVGGAPGNVSQIRECSAQLFRNAKEKDWSLFLVGHITKDGSIAGPKLLEHMVDVVVYFEGDSLYQYRILRSLKNRYGPANEIGLFMMAEKGLKEVKNPSQMFIPDIREAKIGSCIICSFEGSRPILAEVQALVSRTNYGLPQRTVSGFDQKKLALILAILEKHCGLNFSLYDVFIKIAGGLKIDDPGVDLGLAAAIYSSLVNQSLKAEAVYIGEIGLNGSIRPVSQIERRIDESLKLGFKSVYLPKMNDMNLNRLPENEFHFLTNISDLIDNKKSKPKG
jgi:DNA repair protein RadA/Sms